MLRLRTRSIECPLKVRKDLHGSTPRLFPDDSKILRPKTLAMLLIRTNCHRMSAQWPQNTLQVDTLKTVPVSEEHVAGILMSAMAARLRLSPKPRSVVCCDSVLTPYTSLRNDSTSPVLGTHHAHDGGPGWAGSGEAMFFVRVQKYK